MAAEKNASEDQSDNPANAEENLQGESSGPAEDSHAEGEQNTQGAQQGAEEAVDAQVAELKDQLLRQMAEVENIKRRAGRDVENAHKYATEQLLNDLFPVLDSLEKAVETAAATEGAQAIAEGVGLSLKLFVDTLAKNGVQQIDPLGEPFDPQHHEAMTMVPNPDAEPNSVMDVMAKGYLLNGRLVRAAKVIVVKGD